MNLRNGERWLYAQAKRGSAREKMGPLSSSREVLSLHSVTGTFGSLMNVRLAASNVFNDLDDI